MLLTIFGTVSPAESNAVAKPAIKKALEIDDSLGEAHASLGLLLCSEFDLHEGKQEFLRAIALSPNYANAHYWLSSFIFIPLGEFDHAMAELKRALEVDPLSQLFNATLGSFYTMT